MQGIYIKRLLRTRRPLGVRTPTQTDTQQILQMAYQSESDAYLFWGAFDQGIYKDLAACGPGYIVHACSYTHTDH